jgi:glycosyltransferase involved in cell wall biosynthesis
VGDPWDDPIGGQATFAKQLLIAFGSKMAVSSQCNDPTVPIGKWICRFFRGTPICFFNRGQVNTRRDKKPLIPLRVQAFFKAKFYLPKIREKEFDGVLIDSPELLFAAMSHQWNSICYSFAGLNNPVLNSRYRFLRIFGWLFEKVFINCLLRSKPDILIAAADKKAIFDFHCRTNNFLNSSKFHQFPTRVDTEVFHPSPMAIARNEVDLPLRYQVFVVIGRISWIKGWDFLLEAFCLFKELYSYSMLVFVGDGEDHLKLEKKARYLNIFKNIRITGFLPQKDVVNYLNSADVCLVGSHAEGWSLAMCEMLACGKPIVSTNVSGVQDMIIDGCNGFVVPNRDPKDFSKAMIRALSLDAASYSLSLSQRYSVKNLASDLGNLWFPLKER